jgi:hypothetical protein
MERLFSPCTRLHDILESQGRLGEPQAAPAHCFALTMARLFLPCTRLYNHLLEAQGRLEVVRDGHFAPELVKELNLDVSTEEFLSSETAFTYADLYAMLGGTEKVVWLTPHAAVIRENWLALDAWEQLDDSCRFSFSVDGKDIIALALSSEHLLEICDVVLRLLAVSVVHSIHLINSSSPDFFINAPILAYLIEQCQSLKVLSLNDLEMDEDHCRVLGAYSRPGLEIVLTYCNITSAGASALVEVLGRNRGPTKLDLHTCDIDIFILADGLRGNSSLKLFRPGFAHDQALLAIAGALKENKGLVELNFRDSSVSRVSNDGVYSLEAHPWGAICDSLKTHPTLQVLDISRTNRILAPAELKFQIQVLLDMMKVNMSIHSIHLDTCHSQHELFRKSVIPYLRANRLRPRLLAIQKARPISYRAKVVGRALISARDDASSVWMLLSGNAEVVFT